MVIQKQSVLNAGIPDPALARRLKAERARIEAGDVPDLVKRLPDDNPEEWLDKQPLTVAGRPDRWDLPVRIAYVIHYQFRLPCLEGMRLIGHWLARCDPRWRAECSDQLMFKAAGYRYDLQRQEAERKSALDWGHSQEIASGWLDAGGQGDDWLVDGLLLAGDNVLLAGPVKSLKTHFAYDLAVSLDSGTPFLGSFAVPRPRRVLLVNAENGRAQVHRKLILAHQGRGLDHYESCIHTWCRCPDLTDPQVLRGLGRYVKAAGITVVIVDPLYKVFPGVNAADMFSMGPALGRLGDTLRDAGAELVLVHHSGKDLPPGRLMTLEDAAFGGPAMHARQWLLVNRVDRFDPRRPGEHRLAVNFGGSTGVAGVFAVQASEGIERSGRPATTWQARVHAYAAELPAAAERGTSDEKRLQGDAVKVLAALADGEEVPQQQLQKRTKLNGSRLLAALDQLCEGGEVSIRQEAVPHGGRDRARNLVRTSTSGVQTRRPTP
jgi:hypothetical protein